MRHRGTLNNTGARVAVVYMQLPEAPQHALIINIDTLPNDLKQHIEDLLANDGQKVESFSQLLMGRMMPNSTNNLLVELHQRKLLQKVTVDEVNMVPRNDLSIPLRTVLEELNKLAKAEGSEKPNPILMNSQVGQSQSAAQMANNMLVEAKMLEDAASQKREQAYLLSPALRPVTTVRTSAAQAAQNPYATPAVAEESKAVAKDTKKPATKKTSAKTS